MDKNLFDNINVELEQFINDNCDFTSNTISLELLKKIEQDCGIKFGSQLSYYIIKYGYLGYEDIELYGINSKEGINSDLLVQTRYLHDYFENTKSFIVIDKMGEFLYSLVDKDDNIYVYDINNKTCKFLNIKLFDYVLKRFKRQI